MSMDLKLTQKTREYDSLQTPQTDCNPSNVVTETVRNQSIKQEPQAVGIVNVPASSTSRSDEPRMKTRSKRGITAGDDKKEPLQNDEKRLNRHRHPRNPPKFSKSSVATGVFKIGAVR